MDGSPVEAAASAMLIMLEKGFLQAKGSVSVAALAHAAVSARVDSAERSSALELAMKSCVLRFFCQPAHQRPLQLIQFMEGICDFALDAATETVAGSVAPLADHSLVFIVLEDLFEAVPVVDIEATWRVVEERRQRMHPLVQTGGRARLALLRLTSGLLRRLSRTQDTVMCGKVLLFLAFVIPLYEKSGVNQTGAFNVDNITTYEGEAEDAALLAAAVAYKAPAPAAGAGSGTDRTGPVKPAAGAGPPPSSTSAASATPTGTPSKSEPDSHAHTLDGRFALRGTYDAVATAYTDAEKGEASSSLSFYRSFWRLQHLLYHPSLVCTGAESWALWVGTLRVVLRAFEREDVEAGVATASAQVQSKLGKPVPGSKHFLPPAIPTLTCVTVSSLDKQVTSTGSAAFALAGMGQGTEAALSTGAGAKFLTYPSLLALELRDASLRRHVLLQALLALHYFSLPRKGDKDKPTSASPTAGSDLLDLRLACFTLLRRTSPDGPAFASAVRGILEREGAWSAWKQASAPAMGVALGPAPPDTCDELIASSSASAGSKRCAEEGKAVAAVGGASAKFARTGGAVGRSAASSLRRDDWASQGADTDLLATCCDPNRAVRPSLLAYLVPYRMALDPAMGIEPESSPAGDRTYTWRGLRLLACADLPAMAGLGQGKDKSKDAERGRAAAVGAGSDFATAVSAATGMRIPQPPPLAAPSPMPLPPSLPAPPPDEDMGQAVEREGAPEQNEQADSDTQADTRDGEGLGEAVQPVIEDGYAPTTEAETEEGQS